jgi:hypothetical protein
MANRDGDRFRQETQFPVRFRPPSPAAKPFVDEETESGQSQPLASYSGEGDLLQSDQRFQHGMVFILISDLRRSLSDCAGRYGVYADS